MRICRAVFPDGRTWIATIGADGNAIPIREQRPQPGSDPLRDVLAEASDLAKMPGAGPSAHLSEILLLSPVAAPQKILAIGMNYADHARESGLEPPTKPVVFAKFPNSLLGPSAPISYSLEDSTQVDYEAELAIVMGRRTRRASVENALDHILGFTACNDVSAREVQLNEGGQWVRGKSFDTFCPIGPWIVTGDEIGDPQDLAIACRVNGETLQSGTTADMIFSCAELIAFVSRAITLEAGDIIATGTPFGIGMTRKPPVWLNDGDVVEIDIERIGVLANSVTVVP